MHAQPNIPFWMIFTAGKPPLTCDRDRFRPGKAFFRSFADFYERFYPVSFFILDECYGRVRDTRCFEGVPSFFVLCGILFYLDPTKLRQLNRSILIWQVV